MSELANKKDTMTNHDQYDDDDLTGIFDELTPEDFVVSVRDRTFDRFVRQNIETLRTSYLAADGQINPVAIMATKAAQWTFAPTDDETLGEYCERLGAEARRLKAEWLFISRKTLVGTGADTSIDTTDPERIQKAIEQGALVEGVFYYAARLRGGVQEHRHGIMRALPGFKLGDAIEGSPEQNTALFGGILG